MAHIPQVLLTSCFPIWDHHRPEAAQVWIISVSQLSWRHLRFIFSSFEALNQSSSASARQSHAAAYALAGIDKHFGFHIQLHPVNPRAKSVRLQEIAEAGNHIKVEMITAHKEPGPFCRYQNMRVSRGDCATSRLLSPQAETAPAPPGRGFGNPVSVKLLTTCKWQLGSKMWVFPRWHFVFSLMNRCQTDKKTCRGT